MIINPIFLKDFYKIGHVQQYPKGTTLVFSNFTPRKSRVSGINHSVFFGLQYFIKEYLIEQFQANFFERPTDLVVEEYRAVMKATLGSDDSYVHIRKLHELGYLPIAIHALPELTVVPEKVPALVIYNTHPEFFWLPNALETIMSCILWGMCTSATTAHAYRQILDKYAAETSDNPGFVDYQAHDFSFRGMFGLEAAMMSGAAHLQYFKGTDTIPALFFNQEYYEQNYGISSVPATEHSVMSAGSQDDELETYCRLINEIYPSDILSIVSDTYDLWHVVDNFLPQLKDDIMKRDGKVVIRPDSGDPADIICGKPIEYYKDMEAALTWVADATREQAVNACEGSHNCGQNEYSQECKIGDEYFRITFEFDYNRYDKRYYYVDGQRQKCIEKFIPESQQKGLIERLWEIFGGTINSKGYKELDSHIGAIYGDSITLERADTICARLKVKGFASTNIVFGVGSYSYQCVTRDTLGWAMKATYCEINGVGRDIFKNPKTDDGTKKSAKGLLRVVEKDGALVCEEQQTWGQFNNPDNELKLVFKDGKICQ